MTQYVVTGWSVVLDDVDSPEEAARVAHEIILDAANSGYQPILTVRSDDGAEVTIDIAEICPDDRSGVSERYRPT